LDENPDTTGTPCLNNDLDYSGAIHEIVDGAVPIYTKDIKDCYYLHDTDLEEAYRNSGIGDGTEENHIQVAIYCYIQDKVNEWYNDNADDVCAEWRKQQAIKKVDTLTLEQCKEVLKLDEIPAECTLESLRDEVLEGLTEGEIEPEALP